MIEIDPHQQTLEAVSRAERAEAELAIFKQQATVQAQANDRKVLHKISILRLIFTGITALMAFLGILVVINWSIPDTVDKDGIGATFFQTSKDILLVLSGILGSAMANVFDARDTRATDTKADKPEQPAE